MSGGKEITLIAGTGITTVSSRNYPYHISDLISAYDVDISTVGFNMVYSVYVPDVLHKLEKRDQKVVAKTVNALLDTGEAKDISDDVRNQLSSDENEALDIICLTLMDVNINGNKTRLKQFREGIDIIHSRYSLPNLKSTSSLKL